MIKNLKNTAKHKQDILKEYLLHVLQFGTPEERVKILRGITSRFDLRDTYAYPRIVPSFIFPNFTYNMRPIDFLADFSYHEVVVENNLSFQQGNQIRTNNISSKHLSKIFIILIIVIGFITTFVSGYFVSRLLATEQNITTGKNTQTKNIPYISNITSNPTTNNPQVEQDSTKFLPGKHYFDDTIMIVTKDKPQINVVATVTRAEQDNNYAQSTRVSYYDGSNWTRQSASKISQDSTIVSNNLVKSWNTTIDPSRVLKQTAQGEITINNSSLVFSTGVLQNEIGIRSLPGYTKFMSNGTGTLTVNGVAHQVYVLYTRIYSLNAAEIQFYNQPFGVTTDYIAFWDTQGNFYHVDATSVDKPTPTYQTHQLGIMEDTNGAVEKTFSVTVNRDSKNPPEKYTASLNNPIGATLNFNRVNGINKAPDGSFTWYMGNIEGTVQRPNSESLSGIGLVEYIHN